MKTCREIIEWFNGKWPESLACEWDNVGLLAGRTDKEIRKIYVALDATDEVIEAAAQEGVDMLITHHPLIFGSIKKINDTEPVGRRILKLIQSDISYYAGHTSFDIAEGGMADLAAERLGVFWTEGGEGRQPFPLEVTGEQGGKPVGIGKAGEIKAPLSVTRLAERVKELFSVPAVTVYSSDPERAVKRAAVSPGSGKSMIHAAIEAKADVLITGDIGHHEGLDLMAEGVSLIDAGHYGLEHIFVDAVAEALTQADFGIEVIKAPVSYPCRVI